jgi:Leucine-rich repeat (LRR) protein
MNLRTPQSTFETEKGYETFRQVESLSIGRIKDIDAILSELQSCRTLRIVRNNTSLNSLPFVNKLRFLDLSECSFVETLPNNLVHLQSVSISHCSHFQLIPELPNLQTLRVVGWSEFRSFTSFGTSDQPPMRSVHFAGCINLDTVFVERQIFRLTLWSKVTVENPHLVTKITRHDPPSE